MVKGVKQHNLAKEKIVYYPISKIIYKKNLKLKIYSPEDSSSSSSSPGSGMLSLL